MSLRDFDNITDPWEYLNTVRQVDIADRPTLLPRWLELVNQRPAAEQDALTAQGKELWQYKMETVRQELKQLRSKDAGDVDVAPTVESGEEGFLAEMIYNPQLATPFMYLVHHFNRPDDPPALVDKIQLGKKTYYPPVSPLVERDVVMVPSGIEEYLDEATLFADLLRYLDDFVYIPNDAFRQLIVAYILMTWQYNKFAALGYLRALGDWGSGKTRLIQTVGHLCYRPCFANGAITPASVFRMIDWYGGTLVIDEANYRQSEAWEELVKLLNSGYQRGFPVWRAERDKDNVFRVQVFDCYGPKLLATREAFDDAALESRCLTYRTELVPNLPATIPLTFNEQARQRAAALRNKLLLWRFRNYQQITVDPFGRVDGVELRVQQITQPLLAVLKDPKLKKTIIDHAIALGFAMRETRSETLEGRILAAMGTPTLLGNARLAGHWRISDVTTYLNAGVPDRHQVSEKTVGRRMKNVLGFRRVTAEGNVAAYAFDQDLLKRKWAAYGLALADNHGNAPADPATVGAAGIATPAGTPGTNPVRVVRTPMAPTSSGDTDRLTTPVVRTPMASISSGDTDRLTTPIVRTPMAPRVTVEASCVTWNESEVVRFWHFVCERHRIFLQRVVWRTPPPWTDDRVLATVYTTNVYRELDRGTRYVVARLMPHASEVPTNTFWNVLVYRAFNWIETYEALGCFQPAEAWDPARAINILAQRQHAGEKVFTGAYRVSQRGAPADQTKAEIVVGRLTAIHGQLMAVFARLQAAKSLAEAHRMLTSLPGLSGFTAYEIVSDLIYNKAVLPFGEDDWVHVGPGAMEGLKLLVVPNTGLTPELAAAAVHELRWNQEQWRTRAGVVLQGPALTLRNVEHALCEYQKIARARRGERPKRRFDPDRANPDLSLWDTIPSQFVVPRLTPVSPQP